MTAVVEVATARALGTGVQVAVRDAASLAAARDLVLSHLHEVDAALSRFRSDSEISRINAAEGAAVRVSALCLRAIDVALDVSRRTDGLVDPTVGAALEAAGYDRDFALVSAARAPLPAGATAGGVSATWRDVEVDAVAGTVRVPDGVHLDLGSSAKALAADDCAAAVQRTFGCGVLVSLGGDIAVAGAPPPGGWLVRIAEDHAAPARTPGQTVAISGGGLATSSTTVRAWHGTGGSQPHHIIDPRTGGPAAVVWRTASVTARSCVEANAAATASIVLGHAAPAWLTQRGLPARLVAANGAVTHLNGWPEAGEQE